MNELKIKRIKESVNCKVKIFLKSGFRYAGTITGADDNSMEILDFKSGDYHIFEYSILGQVDIKAREDALDG